MKFTHLISMFVFFILITFSCKEEKELFDLTDHTSYFPLAVGKYWVYSVDTIYSSKAFSGLRRDTVSIEAKEEVVEQFVTESRDTFYKVERYERPHANANWVIKKVFTISRDGNKAIKTEDNFRFIKLTFPVKEGNQWKSTVFFPEDATIFISGKNMAIFKYWESEIEKLDYSYKIGKLTFEEIAEVYHANEKNVATEYRVVKEVYAKGVGLIQSEWIIYDTQCLNLDCQKLSWEDKVENGFKLTQKLIDYQ